MSNFKERLIAFSELGTLFKENVDKKENKKFPEWDTVLEKTLIESHSYNSWFTIDNLKLSLKNWSNSLQENIYPIGYLNIILKINLQKKLQL